MSFIILGKELSEDEVLECLKKNAGVDYNADMLVILKTGVNSPSLLPTITMPSKSITDAEGYLAGWVQKYINGYKNRPSVKKGKTSNIVPDTLVSYIFSLLNDSLSSKEVEFAKNSHTTMMRIENIIGEMLEEFLSVKLKPKGWVCCWGSTLKSADFCNSEGQILQIKTSDNSENSSSSAIRTGTSIQKWARRRSTKSEQYYWDKLQQITGVENLNEKTFRDFVTKLLQNNPECIYLK